MYFCDVVDESCVVEIVGGAMLLLACVIGLILVVMATRTTTTTTTARWRGLSWTCIGFCVGAVFVLNGSPLLKDDVSYDGALIFFLVSVGLVAVVEVALAWKEGTQQRVGYLLMHSAVLVASLCVGWRGVLGFTAAPASSSAWDLASECALVAGALLLFLSALGGLSVTISMICVTRKKRIVAHHSLTEEGRPLLAPVVINDADDDHHENRDDTQSPFDAARVSSLEDAEKAFPALLKEENDYDAVDADAHADASTGDSATEAEQDGSRGRAFFWETFRSEWGLLLSAFIVAFFAVGASFAESIFWGLIVGLVSQQQTNADDALTLLLEQSGRLLLLTLIVSVTSSAETALIRAASLRITSKIRIKTFQCMVDQPMSKQDQARPGEMMSRLTNDVDQLSGAISTHFVRLCKAIIMTVAGMAFLFYLSWELTLGIMASFPVIGLVTFLQSKMVSKTTTRSLNAAARSVSVAEEVFSAIRTVTAFRTQTYECNRFARHTFGSFLLGKMLIFLNGISDVAVHFIFGAVVVGGIYFAGRRVVLGEGSVGETVTYLLVVMDLAMHVEQIPDSIAGLSEGRGAAASLVTVIHEGEVLRQKKGLLLAQQPPEFKNINNDNNNNNNNNENNDGLDLDLFLEGVSFVYPSRPGVMVLRDISLRMPYGSAIAIVGKSGSGKTSLISLLLRLYDPTQGRVVFRGRDLSAYSEQELGDSVALVPQEPILFHASVRENIAYGKGNCSLEDVERAAKLANADGFIRELPNGYDTNVGSHGALLSGGQRQRICIARALVRDPKCLILDEPTASLDSESELVVVQTLRDLLLSKGRIVILVTHHLSLMPHVDRVAFMEKGTLSAVGTHTELLQNHEAYRQHFGGGGAF